MGRPRWEWRDSLTLANTFIKISAFDQYSFFYYSIYIRLPHLVPTTLMCSNSEIRREENETASWETQCSLVSLNECMHVRWSGSSRFECWQIGPAVVWLGSMLCSHAFGSSIKQLTESTLDYLSYSFTAVDTGDPHHSCRSHSYAHTLSFLHTRIQMHTTITKHLYGHILVRGHARTCIHTAVASGHGFFHTHRFWQK